MNLYDQNSPLAISVKEACRLLSLGRTRVYELINEGLLDSTKVGSRRLVLSASLHRLLAEGA